MLVQWLEEVGDKVAAGELAGLYADDAVIDGIRSEIVAGVLPDADLIMSCADLTKALGHTFHVEPVDKFVPQGGSHVEMMDAGLPVGQKVSHDTPAVTRVTHPGSAL